MASSSFNYKELVEKFDVVMNHNDELANIIEILKQDKTFSNIAFTLPIVEKSIMDEYASCINIIHDEFYSPSWNETCIENVVVKSCGDLIAQENEDLFQSHFLKILLILFSKRF